MKFYRLVIGIQAAYMLVTAVWPIVHIESFIAVTGPKTDVWLVKTVAALLLPMSAALFYQLCLPFNRTAVVIGAGSAAAFMIIDFYYALRDTISDVYLADGIVQLLFLISWIVIVFIHRNISN